MALLRLAAFTGERDYEQPALDLFRALHQAAARHPQAFGHLLLAMHFHFAPPREVALVGDDLEPFRRAAAQHPPRGPASSPARPPATRRPRKRSRSCATANRSTAKPAAYVCENFTCRLPVTEPGRAGPGAGRRGLIPPVR